MRYLTDRRTVWYHVSMSTYKTPHGTVNYSGIRRYIVVSNGRTVKRTDNIETARLTTRLHARHGATVVDTAAPTASAPHTLPSDRVCAVCHKSHVPEVDWIDPIMARRHWHCIPATERARISAAFRAASQNGSVS